MNNITDYTYAEINYDICFIKKITPYLDDIKDKNGRPLRNKARAYAWYYVFNNNIKADAYRRAYHSRYNPETGKLEEIIRGDLTKKEAKARNVRISVKANELHSYPYIQQCVELIEKDHIKKIKKTLPQSMLEQLVIHATYDPSMFFTPRGRVAFKTWEEIPEKYRCCVEGIETRAYGKDGNVRISTIKLVDRDKARKYLLQICPGLLEAEKHEIIHKTIDENGAVVGMDVKKLTDAELIQKYQELKNREK
ncbi:MAG: hypothetical protein PVI88_00050 [Nitrosopumilaceae archaeon]|jgi:hypothetical protein